MTELKELLEGQVAQQPHDSGDAQAAIRAGRRKLHTRRAVAATGTVGLAAVLAGVVVLSNTVAPESEPGPATSPAKSIAADIGDAKDAVEGTDYRVVDRNLRKDTDESEKIIAYSGFTPDGTGVGWIPYGSHTLQIDLSTLEHDRLEPPERADIDPVYVGDDKLMFRNHDFKSLLIFNRDTRQWDKLEWSALPNGSWPAEFAVGSDDRIYLGVKAEGAPEGTLDLWSIDPDDSTDLRDEHEKVGSIARVGSSLVWTDPTSEKSPYVYVRDAASGDTRKFDTGTGSKCSTTVTRSGNDDIILTQGKCTDGDRVTAYSLDGRSKVTVTGDNVTAGGVNDTHILLYGPSATYTADLDSGRLLKVSDEGGYEAAFLSGSYVFWNEPAENPSVMQVAAEMK